MVEATEAPGTITVPQHQSPPHAMDSGSEEVVEHARTSSINRLSCLYCKNRKLKCDRRMPTCGRCTQFDKECVFPRQRLSNVGKKKQVRDLEAKLAQVEDQINDLNSRYSHLQAPSSGLAGTSTGDNGSINLTAGPQPSTSLGNTITTSHFPSVPMTNISIQPSLPPENVREELNRVYFDRFSHAAPMMHPQRYLDSLLRPPAEQPPLCLQLIILALASTIHPPYASQAKAFYVQARAAAEEDEMKDEGQHFVTRAHIQAWVLMSNFEAQNAMFTRASTSCCQAIRLAQILNLHQLSPGLPSTEDPSQGWIEEEESRRTWWIAFVSDRLIFATTGIPVMVNVADVKTPLPASEEAFINMQMEPTSDVHEAIKQPQLGISPLAARVLAAELFYRSFSTMSAPRCPVNEAGTPHGGCRPGQDIENSLVLLAAALPDSLRLPGASRSQHAIFVNVLIQTASICLHKALLQLGVTYTMDETILRRGRDRVITAANEIIHIFSLSQDLQVALRNPVLCFAAYTVGLVFAETVVRDGNASGTDSVRFLLSMLNAVGPRHTVAAMLASQLAEHSENMGVELSASPTQVSTDPTYSMTSRDFAEQLATYFGR